MLAQVTALAPPAAAPQHWFPMQVYPAGHRPFTQVPIEVWPAGQAKFIIESSVAQSAGMLTVKCRWAADVSNGARVAGTALAHYARADGLVTVEAPRSRGRVRAAEALVAGEAGAAHAVHTCARRLCAIRTNWKRDSDNWGRFGGN